VRGHKLRVALIVGAAVVLTGGLALVGCAAIYYSMGRAARGRIFRDASEAPRRDVALVLGARVFRDGRLSDMLADRVRAAVQLHEAGKVGKLIMSGDNSRREYDEPTAMRQLALKLGVPPDDVVRDFAGFRTLDSLYRARDLWGAQSVIVVSQEFHLPRSLFLADRLGVDAVAMSADLREYGPMSSRRAKVREFLARTGAWVDMVILRTKPKFLGQKESLSGIAQERAMGERN
jgi:SanA protein